MIMSMFTQKAN